MPLLSDSADSDAVRIEELAGMKLFSVTDSDTTMWILANDIIHAQRKWAENVFNECGGSFESPKHVLEDCPPESVNFVAPCEDVLL